MEGQVMAVTVVQPDARHHRAYKAVSGSAQASHLRIDMIYSAFEKEIIDQTKTPESRMTTVVR